VLQFKIPSSIFVAAPHRVHLSRTLQLLFKTLMQGSGGRSLLSQRRFWVALLLSRGNETAAQRLLWVGSGFAHKPCKSDHEQWDPHGVRAAMGRHGGYGMAAASAWSARVPA